MSSDCFAPRIHPGVTSRVKCNYKHKMRYSGGEQRFPIRQPIKIHARRKIL